MQTIFKKSMDLNQKIEEFLNVISKSLLLFDKMIKSYLDQDYEDFEETIQRIQTYESKADALETEIKVNLYKFLLLPDVRADLLSLIKSLDNIIDMTEEISKDFLNEKPKLPESLHKKIIQLTQASIQSSEAIISATRAFLGELHLVNDHINKVKFYEHEADILEDKIVYSVFNDHLFESLAEKMQIKAFINKVSDIADECEQIADKLTIFTIKREI